MKKFDTIQSQIYAFLITFNRLYHKIDNDGLHTLEEGIQSTLKAIHPHISDATPTQIGLIAQAVRNVENPEITEIITKHFLDSISSNLIIARLEHLVRSLHSHAVPLPHEQDLPEKAKWHLISFPQ